MKQQKPMCSNKKLEYNGVAVYQMKETHIEQVNDDGTCLIKNPYWDWDDEYQCV
jgi:hypothetical protein